MNKIYKVIWSKVKNQYVVVSEFAHSSGKQSRTSRSSIRSRIAALVVCGAIAAFGVLPMNSASAQYNTEELPQYVVATDNIGNGDGITITTEDHPYDASWKDHHYEKISINTGDGLSIDKNNNVVIDLASGKGLDFYLTRNVYDKDGNLIATKGQIGIKLSTNEEGYDNSGLITDDNGLKINNGDTLKIDGNKLDVKLADNSLTTETNGQKGLKVNVQEGSGLTAKDIQNRPQGLKVETGNGLKIDSNAVAVDVRNNSGLIADTTNGLAIKLDKGNDISKNTSGLTVTNSGLKVNAGNGLSTETGQLAVKLDGKSLSASEDGLKVKVKANSGLDTTTDGLAVKLVEANSGLATDGGLHVNTGAGLSTESGQLAVKLAEEDSGLKIENGALSIDKDAFSTGSTNVKAGTNIDVADDGTVSLKSDVTLDTDTKNDNKIDLSGTNGTISAVNSKSSVDGPSGEWYENKTTTTNKITNTFDFSDGGKFVTEKNENTVVKGPGNLVTLYGKDITTKNTTEFNENGATFTKEENTQKWIETPWNTEKPVGEPITNTSSTNIDGGTITLSSNTRGENKVVIDGTTGEMTGLSNTTWDARKAANGKYESSTKAATEAQLQGVYNTAEDAYDTAEDAKNEAGKHTTVKLSDKNLTLKKGTNEVGGAEYTLGLNSVVTLNGDKPDGDGIVLNGESGSIHAVNTQAIGDGFFGNKIDLNKFDFDNDGAKFVTVKTKFGTAVKDGIEVHTTEFNENGATFTKTSITEDNMKLNNSSTNIDGGVVTTDKVQGLDNTKWDDGLANAVDKSKRLQGMAATQGQLKDVYTEASKHTTVDLADENGNLTLEEGQNEAGGKEYTLGLKDDLNVTSITTGNTKLDSNGLTITGTNGNTTLANDGLTIAGTTYVSSTGLNAGDKVISGVKAGVSGTDAVNVSQLKAVEATANKGWTAKVGNKDIDVKPGDTLQFKGDNNINVAATGNTINVGLKPVVTLDANKFDGNRIKLDGERGAIYVTNRNILGVTHGVALDENGATFARDGWINDSFTNINGGTVTTDKVKGLDNTTINYEGFATEGKAATEEQVKQAAAASKTTVSAGDSNIKIVTETDDTDKHTNYKVSLDDNITLGENANAININGTNGTLKIGNGANAIKMDGVNGTLNIGSKFSVAEDGTVLSDGDVIANADGGEKYSLTELGKYAVKYDETAFDNGTPTITLASGSDNKGTRIRNVADGLETKDAVNLGQLQSTEKHIATNVTANGETPEFNGAYAVGEDGKITLTEVNGAGKETGNKVVLSNIASMDALKEVEATANKGWTAKVGTEEIDVKPGKTLNFNGDENITVSATTSEAGDNAINVKLNDNITLGDKTNTSLTLYTDSNYAKDKDGNFIKDEDGNFKTGYIPDSYYALDKTDPEYQKDTAFFEEHGGFLLYSTNAMGAPMFGVTTDGVVHAKDVVSYTGSDIKYSLNDVGDIVTQIKHAVFNDGEDATHMEYTLISDFINEEDKENPFEAINPDGTTTEAKRTIGLAVRQDGAVVVGAVVNGESQITDSGIRLNDGEATITGLENTEWKPKAPEQTLQAKMVTFAANDGTTTTETSRAATEAQLDDLYDAVAVYNTFNKDGSVNYDTIKLRGTEYDKTTHKNGTLVTNVAYATTNKNATNYDGSAAVNVDVLNNAIAGVEAGTSADIGDLDYGNVTGTDIGKGQDVTTAIGKVNNKVDNLDNKVGDLVYSKFENDTTPIQDGDSVTEAIGKLNNSINGVTQDVVSNSISGGHVDTETGDIVLEKGNGSTVTVGTLTDSVIDSAELKDGTLTITSKDKYSKEETSSVKVEGIASTEVVGAKNKEDLATAYKDADKDGNATTEYITDSETMVDADVALDHAIQDVASTSYANDMALSNRIDNVEKRLGDVEQRIDKVGAMAAAIANLRTMGFDPEAPTEIAVGVGQYKSETGLAIGVFHYPNQDFMLSASLSTSGDEVMGGIGATWRIGRKTAAEKAKDEEKRILAKAEEIKQAAKRAEVKAQADRHAKLLAEREAKGESIRPIENKVEQTQEQA